jgi:hypothetical protein
MSAVEGTHAEKRGNELSLSQSHSGMETIVVVVVVVQN